MFTIEHKSSIFSDLLDLMKTIKSLRAVSSLLGWDQETYMPKGAYEHRADQISTIDTISHELLCSDRAMGLAEKLRDYCVDLNDYEKRLVFLFLREYDKACKLPQKLISDISRTKAIATESWKKALKNSNFRIFEPDLEALLDLKIEEAKYLEVSDNYYDSLLDYYEPGLGTADIDPLFNVLKSDICKLLEQVNSSDIIISDSFLHLRFPRDRQLKLSAYIARKMAFDFFSGRLDESIHPFTSLSSSKDVRITTMIEENDLKRCLYSVIHEVGHGLYEQGMESLLYGTFAAGAPSFAMHEAQALIWENNIAHSYEFCLWLLPLLKKQFPEQFKFIGPMELYKTLNKVEPGFIRTEADELTYNLHIMLRYEIEKGLMNSDIKVSDIPSIWNLRMKEYLGIMPEIDADGCLQDIHWSCGDLGYFPSYTIGLLYAAMIWEAMNKEVQDLASSISKGKFMPIRDWLKNKIHLYGNTESSDQIIERTCKKGIEAGSFINYIKKKYSEIYT